MNEIQKLESEIAELNKKLYRLRKEAKPVEVKNYSFSTLTGKTTLLDLFEGKDQLIVIHNRVVAIALSGPITSMDLFHILKTKYHLFSSLRTILIHKDDSPTHEGGAIKWPLMVAATTFRNRV